MKTKIVKLMEKTAPLLLLSAVITSILGFALPLYWLSLGWKLYSNTAELYLLLEQAPSPPPLIEKVSCIAGAISFILLAILTITICVLEEFEEEKPSY